MIKKKVKKTQGSVGRAGTRQLVEEAIELAKGDKSMTWELGRRRVRRVSLQVTRPRSRQE